LVDKLYKCKGKVKVNVDLYSVSSSTHLQGAQAPVVHSHCTGDLIDKDVRADFNDICNKYKPIIVGFGKD